MNLSFRLLNHEHFKVKLTLWMTSLISIALSLTLQVTQTLFTVIDEASSSKDYFVTVSFLEVSNADWDVWGRFCKVMEIHCLRVGKTKPKCTVRV